ncbi:MAG: hypothetical protein DMD61_09185 [Gemmatimonadetes bacterium]|nr:MAG: hypothetical protein DMD61_09185 [Gemmatimonadota bacterium]
MTSFPSFVTCALLWLCAPIALARAQRPDTAPAHWAVAERTSLRVRIRQEDAPEHFTMPVPLKIGFADTTLHALARLSVTGSVTETTLDLPAEPKRLEFNPFQSVLAQIKDEPWE